MRLLLLAALALTAAPVVGQTADAPTEAHAMDGHGGRLYSFTRLEGDYAPAEGGVATWDAEGWLGGDRHKFWWKSEGEVADGRAERAEAQALYSRNVWTFFDAQLGVRHDFTPAPTTWAVVGVQGLAPYFLETELHAFVSTRGDVQLRARQSFDLLLTNRLILEPQAEIELELRESARREVASGFSRGEAGVQARYEINRKLAPYVAAVWERRLGGTARLARAAGEDSGGWRVSAGLRFWF